MFMDALFEKSVTNNGGLLYSKTYGDIVIYSFLFRNFTLIFIFSRISAEAHPIFAVSK